ncbi:sensor histidine kinase [Legionella pneumophila]|nr:hypothetical protein [Legionella pneumophila]VEB29470.1 sensor histidine kinase [Legionella pneumophila]
MYWRFAKSMSITNRLLLIFIGSTVLILSIITGLIYPPMKELLHHTHLNNEHYNYLLTRICIKNFFVGLWFSTLIIILGQLFARKKKA